MALEIVRGVAKNSLATNLLIESLKNVVQSGTLYTGYPIIASAESGHTIEALLISEDSGFIAFDFPGNDTSFEDLCETQDQLAYLIEGNLKKHETLRSGRKLAVEVSIISFFPNKISLPTNGRKGYIFASPETITEAIKEASPIESQHHRALCAAIQRVTTIKPIKKRENAVKAGSRGAILKIIEKGIANLDQWQKKAAIEAPNGPQRIRGLAGSGKTVVLALKAAYLHANYPEWNIVITYFTRSLHQQIIDLIERFTLEHSGDKPNWDKLRVMHAWGSVSEPGVYSEICGFLGAAPISYALAKDRYGMSGAFEGACNEVLPLLKNNKIEHYDAILVDEAQDLPPSFFKAIYSATKGPKRIVWAYDELQNLNARAVPPLSELFGADADGNPLVSVINTDDEPLRDIILPVCYRNTPWALTVAHALGFGIYKKQLVQLFDELGLWKEIGYSVISGALEYGSPVSLKRNTDSYPSYFTTHLTPEDAVVYKIFESIQTQYEWIAEEISKNIKEDELDPDDILIILPDAYSAKPHFQYVNRALSKHGINSHLAGVSTNRDVFTKQDSVTVSSIYRAKGNEAPMVYVVNAHDCAAGHELIRLRNTLFTAITRSRAWVRVLGVGKGMELIEQEIKRTAANDFQLTFTIPTQEELDNIRIINRDRTKEEVDQIEKIKKLSSQLQHLIKRPGINLDVMLEIQELRKAIGADPTEEE